MNERIRELAIEAGMIIGDTSNFDMAAIMPKESKFAEIIVRECADVAGRDVGHFVLKHFGVEE
jgi:hypothetical protein